jgi:hypothetical protein
MRRKAGLLLIVVFAVVAALAGYMLRGSPAPVSGGEPVKPALDADAQMHAVIAPLKAQDELIAPIVPVAPVLPAEAAPTAPVPAPAAVQPGPDPNEQAELRAIETHAATERQKIEAWYSDEVAKLKTSLEQKMHHLSEVDKLAWAQFYQRANETWSTTDGYDYGAARDYGYGTSYGSGWRSETTRTYVVGDPAGDYAAIMAQIKDSRLATQEDFTIAQKRLAWLREDKLADVQTEVNRRKAEIAWRKSRAQSETARKQAGDPTPRVEAIVGGIGGRFGALIGDGLVSEGAAVQGYRVKKIRVDSVEFEKDGRTWVQKVN